MASENEIFQRGIAQFNAGHFFECHETLEELWLKALPREKAFLQGLIQTAAAFHHYRRGNLAGAKSLLQDGIEKLTTFSPQHRGVAVEKLLGSLKHWRSHLAKVQTADPCSDAPAPPQIEESTSVNG